MELFDGFSRFRPLYDKHSVLIINIKPKMRLTSTLLLLVWVLLPWEIFAQPGAEKRGKTFVFPIITRSLETGWNFGAVAAKIFSTNKLDTVSRSSNIVVVGMFSTRKQVLFALNGTQYFNREQYILEEQLSTSYFPDKFWGLGNNTLDNQEESYSFRQAYLYLHLKRKMATKFFVGIVYEAQKVWDINYVQGGLLDKAAIPGINGYFISGIGTSLSYDSRNNAFAPDKGLYMQLFWNHFDRTWGSDFNYNNWVADIRTYQKLGDKSTLALQLLTFSSNGAEVPLRSLAAFGGATKMRGYYEGRFRDKQQMFFQGEYRFPVYKFLQAVVFGGLGSVASQWKEYAMDNIKYSAGGGLRFVLSKQEKLSLRLDYGIGQGTNRGFYVQLGEAF